MRVLSILKELHKANQYLSIEHFIKRLSISKRTVQKEMSYISSIGGSKGFTLIQKRGNGYLIQIDDSSKFESFLKELERNVLNEVSAENIAAYLSLRENYSTGEEMAEYFECSKTQIRNFRKDVDSYINSYGLNVERRAHYGVKIEESPGKRKTIISDLYIRGNELIKSSLDEKAGDRFDEIKESLLHYISENDYIINDIELEKLFAYLKAYIYTKIVSDDFGNGYGDFSVTGKIGEIYGISVEKEESEKIEKLIKDVVRVRNWSVNVVSEDLESDMNEFFEMIDSEYNTSFGKDEDFKRLLKSHVYLLIERLRSKISYTNGIIEEILIRYPMIFNIAIRFCDMIQRKYDVEITEGEAGFVATHFCVHMEKELYSKYNQMNKIAIVCSSGGGSAYLLKMKIKTLFKNAEVETFSFYDDQNILEFIPDVIFSIKELDFETECPVIIIKELLDEQDILNIRKLLMFDINEQVSIEETPSIFIKQLFDERYFSVESNPGDYMDILKDMADDIEKSGFGGEKYREYVMEREEYVPTIYMNGVSIPHPIKMSAVKNLVAVKILKQPVIYDNKEVKIIFMVSLRKEDYELQKEITKGIYEIMKDVEKVKNIREAESYKQFIALIEPMI